MSTIKYLMNYINNKYLENSYIIEATLSQIQNLKEPRNTFEAVRNIEEALRIFHAIDNSKLNNKIERRHIAVVQAKTILPGCKQLYQDFMCKVLEKGRNAYSLVQAVEEGDQQQNPRDYLLNISVPITSHLNTTSVENERKEFVSYLKQ